MAYSVLELNLIGNGIIGSWKDKKIRIGQYNWNNVLGNNEIDYCLNNYKGKNSILKIWNFFL